MRTTDKIPPAVQRLQREVAAPHTSAWVSANAGSGKTHVLVQRVINLLLDGVQPEKILCITFTRAAAANMAKRVFDTLAQWVTLDDAALDAALDMPSTATPNAARRALARRLFAQALETPGGLKVQTIHAFCTRLLHQFPFEAGVAARFEVLDETEQTELLERLTLAVLLDGAEAPDSPLGRALEVAMQTAADQTFREVIRDAVGMRDAIDGWITAAGGFEAALVNLSRALGVEPVDSRESIEAMLFSASSISPQEWDSIAAVLARGAKTDADQGRRFQALSGLSGAARVKKYLEIFCTGEMTPRQSILTKAIKDAGLADRLSAEQQRVCTVLKILHAIDCRDRSAALVTVVHEVLTRYACEKERRGLLDYDGLIDKTLKLLTNVDAAWVHYKLDLGIDHLLIDEGQDTSKKQWEIVRRLVAEFTAGVGARSVKRTIFAVGDEKQSIYSFQNAAPKEFAEMRRHFETAHKNARLDFAFRRLEHSFRAGPTILAAVDRVFNSAAVAASVTSDAAGFPPHIALPDAPSGAVEIWAPTQWDPRPEIEAWDAPFDRVIETSPRVKLARRIARRVRELVEGGELVGIDRRTARYGDILILVRQRGELFEAIIRALKNQDIEVAGADRLLLTEHIAVMDLMALAEALLLPADDLALATVLRSPLFGFEDDDLFTIAWDRGRASLAAALRRKAAERRIFGEAVARLDTLGVAAKSQTPFAFYAGVLGSGGGRRRFLARLGAEANDALDEFLNLAFEYERRQTPSMQGFVAWLREARAEVKRDMEIARDEVRVMTVHGAKGLEAPIVFLADTMTPPSGPRPPRLVTLPKGPLLWVGRKANDVDIVATARRGAQAEAADEYRRLLYVAMTRAADRLIVCGADGKQKRPAGCWYDLIHGAIEPLVDDGDKSENGDIFLGPAPAAAPARPARPGQMPASPREAEAPVWLREHAPIVAPLPVPLSPSTAFDDAIGRVASAADAANRQKALERGRLVHRLMQSLPDIPRERRKDAAMRYLKRCGEKFGDSEQAEIAHQAIAILDDNTFAPLFAAGSRAEVSIVGCIPRPGAEPILVSGQIDRFVVTKDAVLIADYKTDRAVPQSLDQVEPYIAQLTLYGAVLSRLYPAKLVRSALLFTEGPRLMAIPAEVTDRALQRLLTADITPQVSLS